MRTSHSIGGNLMPFYRSDSQPLAPIRARRAIVALGIAALVAVGGCSRYAEEPEFDPHGWAPRAVDREWKPAPGRQSLVGSAADAAALSDHPPTGRALPL